MNIIRKLRSRYKSYRRVIKEREEVNDIDRLFKAAANLAVEEMGRELDDNVMVEPKSGMEGMK